jgi:hypothetical protein
LITITQSPLSRCRPYSVPNHGLYEAKPYEFVTITQSRAYSVEKWGDKGGRVILRLLYLGITLGELQHHGSGIGPGISAGCKEMRRTDASAASLGRVACLMIALQASKLTLNADKSFEIAFLHSLHVRVATICTSTTPYVSTKQAFGSCARVLWKRCCGNWKLFRKVAARLVWS